LIHRFFVVARRPRLHGNTGKRSCVPEQTQSQRLIARDYAVDDVAAMAAGADLIVQRGEASMERQRYSASGTARPPA